MHGCPGLNHAAFNAGTKALRELGHTVFSPVEVNAELGIKDGAGTKTMIRSLMAAELAWIASTADAVVLLHGWQQSLGALAERATAVAIGIPVYELDKFLENFTKVHETDKTVFKSR
jgi:hypothetical protein